MHGSLVLYSAYTRNRTAYFIPLSFLIEQDCTFNVKKGYLGSATDTLFTANDYGSPVQSVSDWPFQSVRIPAMRQPGSQIHLEGQLDKDKGAFGLDGIHFSTRQRCSPR